jgi:hypothetical protein
VHITITVVSLNPVHGKVYSIQRYVSDRSSTNKTVSVGWLKSRYMKFLVLQSQVKKQTINTIIHFLFSTLLIEHICTFFVTFFSATIGGRDLIFGHKLHIGTPYRGKRF